MWKRFGALALISILSIVLTSYGGRTQKNYKVAKNHLKKKHIHPPVIHHHPTPLLRSSGETGRSSEEETGGEPLTDEQR